MPVLLLTLLEPFDRPLLFAAASCLMRAHSDGFVVVRDRTLRLADDDDVDGGADDGGEGEAAATLPMSL